VDLNTSNDHVRHRKFTHWVETRVPGWTLDPTHTQTCRELWPPSPFDLNGRCEDSGDWGKGFYVFVPRPRETEGGERLVSSRSGPVHDPVTLHLQEHEPVIESPNGHTTHPQEVTLEGSTPLVGPPSSETAIDPPATTATTTISTHHEVPAGTATLSLNDGTTRDITTASAESVLFSPLDAQTREKQNLKETLKAKVHEAVEKKAYQAAQADWRELIDAEKEKNIDLEKEKAALLDENTNLAKAKEDTDKALAASQAELKAKTAELANVRYGFDAAR